MRWLLFVILVLAPIGCVAALSAVLTDLLESQNKQVKEYRDCLVFPEMYEKCLEAVRMEGAVAPAARAASAGGEQ